ncbi:MAG: class I SAM-dependent methyltransferase [Alphaproteobacteria bacterium]
MAKASGSGGGDGAEQTDFGYRRVSTDEHPHLVREVFDSVAGRYDLMNDLMSGGLHRLWKRLLIDRLNPRPGMRLVDIAGGTGDVAARFLQRAGGAEAGADAVICDINEAMLRTGQERFLDDGIIHGISHLCCNAEALAVESRIADCCTIAFGLRNVTRRGPAFAEILRVLKPGGHFLCLEFSPAVEPLLAPLYDAYSSRVLPALGEAITGDRDAYTYLVESIRRFPAPEALAAEMTEAGFGNVTWRAISAGIVAIHSGWRI